jgi:HD superfamily phosphohydrolase
MASVVEKFIDISARTRQADFQSLKVVKLDPDGEDSRAESLRHAALLHDIGHFPFSHAVEKAYQYNPEQFYCGSRSIDDFMFIFDEVLELPTPNHSKLSEYLTLAIILSPRFHDFYERCVMRDAGRDPDRLFRVASLIVGLPPEENFPGIANIISNSAIDADKIDYIKRDSIACGIPVGIDVARLFLRSAFVEIGKEDIGRLFSPDDPRDFVRLFVVNSSGADTVEEIALARASLYHRVYLHQVTRGVERLLTLALIEHSRTTTGREGVSNALFAWSLSDTELLRHLADAGGRIGHLSNRVKNRILLKKACSIGRNTLQISSRPGYVLPSQQAPYPDVVVFRHVAGEALQDFMEETLKGSSHEQLENDIAHEAQQLWKLIEHKASAKLKPATSRPTVTIVPVPSFNQSPPDTIINENGFLVHTPKETNIDELGIAADIFKAQGSVLCDRSWRELVFLATRNVLRARAHPAVNVEVPLPGEERELSTKMRIVRSLTIGYDDGARRAGLDARRLEDFTELAEHAGYFDSFPTLSRPPLLKALTPVARQLRSFNGQGGWQISPMSLQAFVHQFPPRMREEVTDMLNQIRLIDRDKIGNGLRDLMDQALPNQKGHNIVALSPNSGNFVRMIGEQEHKGTKTNVQWEFQKSINEVFDFGDADREVLLVDDNSVTGSQVVAQLHAWMGTPQEQWPEHVKGEQNIDKARFSDRDRDLFRAMHITLGFIYASDEAISKIKETAHNLNLSNFRVIRHEDMAAVTHNPSANQEASVRSRSRRSMRRWVATSLKPD